MLKGLNGHSVQLQGSLLGFKDLNEFQIQPVDDEGLFAYLHSVEDDQIGFVVTSPFSFYKDYAFELDPSTIKDLNTSSHEDIMVLTIITLQEPFRASTVNLLAPIVINVNTWVARQIVLPPHYRYTTKTPLSKPKAKEAALPDADPNA